MKLIVKKTDLLGYESALECDQCKLVGLGLNTSLTISIKFAKMNLKRSGCIHEF